MKIKLSELRSYIKRYLVIESFINQPVEDQIVDLERKAWEVAVKTAETLAPASSRNWDYRNEETINYPPLNREAVTGTVLAWLEDDYAPEMANAMIEVGVEGNKDNIIEICKLIYKSLYTDDGGGNYSDDEWSEEDRESAEVAARNNLHKLICDQFGIKDVTGDAILNIADQMIDWLKQYRSILIAPGDNTMYIPIINKGPNVKKLVKDFKDRFYMPDSITARRAITAIDHVLQCYDYEALPNGYSLGDRTMGSLKPALERVDRFAKMCVDNMKHEENLRQSTNRKLFRMQLTYVVYYYIFMKNYVWMTDVHFDFLGSNLQEQRENIEYVLSEVFGNVSDIAGIFITGDISNGYYIIDHLKILSNYLGNTQLYFVCGNHDFYTSSIEVIRKNIDSLIKSRKSKKNIHYLTQCEPVRLSDTVYITGDDGWYDALYSNYKESSFLMNDWFSIGDFSISGASRNNKYLINKDVIVSVARGLASDSADRLSTKVTTLLQTNKSVSEIIILTHVPPFEEASWHDGARADRNSLPWYSSKIMGMMLRDLATTYPHVKFNVFAGHTHSRYSNQISKNLFINVGPSKYSQPNISGIISLLFSIMSKQVRIKDLMNIVETSKMELNESTLQRYANMLKVIFGVTIPDNPKSMAQLCERAEYIYDSAPDHLQESYKTSLPGYQFLINSNEPRARRLAAKVVEGASSKLLFDSDIDVRVAAAKNAPLAEVKRYLLKNSEDELISEIYSERSSVILEAASKKKRATINTSYPGEVVQLGESEESELDQIFYDVLAKRIYAQYGRFVEDSWIQKAVDTHCRSYYATNKVKIDPQKLKDAILKLRDSWDEAAIASAQGMFTLREAAEKQKRLSRDDGDVFLDEVIVRTITESQTPEYDVFLQLKGSPSSVIIKEGDRLFNPTYKHVHSRLHEGRGGESFKCPVEFTLKVGYSQTVENALDLYTEAYNKFANHSEKNVVLNWSYKEDENKIVFSIREK